jgi:hypothetical protein
MFIVVVQCLLTRKQGKMFPAKQGVQILPPAVYHQSGTNAAPAEIADTFFAEERHVLCEENRPRNNNDSTGLVCSKKTKWTLAGMQVAAVVAAVAGRYCCCLSSYRYQQFQNGLEEIVFFHCCTRRSRVDGPWGCFFFLKQTLVYMLFLGRRRSKQETSSTNTTSTDHQSSSNNRW